MRGDARLSRLEREVSAIVASGEVTAPTAEEDAWDEAVMRLLDTMAPEHVELIVAHAEVEELPPALLRLYRDAWGRIGEAAFHSSIWRLSAEGRRLDTRPHDWRYRPERPLALPPAVVALYLADLPLRREGHVCQDCGYRVPLCCPAAERDREGRIGLPDCQLCSFTQSRRTPPAPEGCRAVLPQCPVCGGRTGNRFDPSGLARLAERFDVGAVPHPEWLPASTLERIERRRLEAGR